MIISLIARLDSQGQTAELAGYPKAWQQFAEVMKSDEAEFELLVPPKISPAPYRSFVPKLKISHTNEKVYVKYYKGILSFSGSPAMLGKLAKRAIDLAEYPKKLGNIHNHVHFEYYPNHSLISEGSLPVVMTVIPPEESWPVDYSIRK
jgi:hypothetical protein